MSDATKAMVERRETMTLVERLRNPAWDSDGHMVEGKPALLNVWRTRDDMYEAAKRIEQLEAALTAAKSEWQPAGREAVLEEAAKLCESYNRDASFDDSMVGAQEHRANQWNIAQAIRALKVTT